MRIKLISPALHPENLAVGGLSIFLIGAHEGDVANLHLRLVNGEFEDAGGVADEGGAQGQVTTWATASQLSG